MLDDREVNAISQDNDAFCVLLFLKECVKNILNDYLRDDNRLRLELHALGIPIQPDDRGVYAMLQEGRKAPLTSYILDKEDSEVFIEFSFKHFLAINDWFRQIKTETVAERQNAESIFRQLGGDVGHEVRILGLTSRPRHSSSRRCTWWCRGSRKTE